MMIKDTSVYSRHQTLRRLVSLLCRDRGAKSVSPYPALWSGVLVGERWKVGDRRE